MQSQSPRYILGCDPSGNHGDDGDGTTGLAVYNLVEDKIEYVEEIKSSDYPTWQEYYRVVWSRIFFYCDMLEDMGVVLSVEDYLIYATHTTQHTFSRVPTARLLGYLLMKCYECGIDYYIRPASDVKNRWTNELLLARGYISGVDNEKSVNHCHGTTKLTVNCQGKEVKLLSHHLDAIRHAVHCGRLEVLKNRGNKNK